MTIGVLMALLAALVVAVTVAACVGRLDSDRTATEEAPQEVDDCRVTRPRQGFRRGQQSFNHGNSALHVALWPNGILIAGPLREGGSYATIRSDGSIEAKLGWWRSVEGQLSVEGKRLDGDAPVLRARVPGGYGQTGFQPTDLIFPTTGCWRVVGSVAGSDLEFVVLVTQ